jgi:hypothetical protein
MPRASTGFARLPHMTKAVFWVALVAGCGGGDTVDCPRNLIQIVTEGMLVSSIALSGPGCDNATIRSDYPSPDAPVSVGCDAGFTPYCQYYYIKPGASGECGVHIELESGVAVDKTTSFSYLNGGICPAGYRIEGDRTWFLTRLLPDGGSG